MIDSTKIDTPEFFRELDDEFINIKSVKDDTFVYKGKDVRVNSTWELPIVIQWPGSSIDFEFTTASGGIEFGIVFVPATDEQPADEADLQIETIEEMTLVRSDLERISGSFIPPSEGVVFFLWDNVYDWSAVKHLSYAVDVFQPSFSLPDMDRSEAALSLLSDVVEDIETSTLRLEHGEDEIEYFTPNVEELSMQYESLRLQLANKMALLSMLDAEEDRLVSLINSNYDSIAGVGIRCLNKHLLSVVLSYIYHPQYGLMDGGAGLVCSSWRQIVHDLRTNGIVSGPVEAFHVRPEKLRFVKRSEGNVRPLHAVMTYYQNAARHRWALMGIDKPPPLPPGKPPPARQQRHHAQWRLSARRHVAVDVRGRMAYRNRNMEDSSTLGHMYAPDSSPQDMMYLFDTHEPSQATHHEEENGGHPQKNGHQSASHSHGDGNAVDSNTAMSMSMTASSSSSSAVGNHHHHHHTADNNSNHNNNNNNDRSNHIVMNSDDVVVTNDSSGNSVNSNNNDSNGLDHSQPASNSGDNDVISHHDNAAAAAAVTAVTAAHDNDDDETNRDNLLMHITKIQSEHQLAALIEYIQDGYVAIEQADNNKRQHKHAIQQWNSAFEERCGRAATNTERKTLARGMYESYQQASGQLKIRCDKVNSILQQVGLTHSGFLKLRDKFIEWSENNLIAQAVG